MVKNSEYKIYLTEVLCVSKAGELAVFGGPNILARNQEEADTIATIKYKNTKVVGRLENVMKWK
jgi:hypothetical protein